MRKSNITSLRGRILLGFTVILLIMFFAALWSIYNFYRLNESIKLTMQHNYESISAADNMIKSLDEQLQAFIILYNQDFEYGKALYQKSKEDFFFWYVRARRSAYTIAERNILDTLNTEYNNFTLSIGDSLDYRSYTSNSDIMNNNFFIIAEEIKNLKSKSNRYFEINHTLLDRAVAETKEITRTATIFILVILVGAITISIVFGTRFSDYVVRPIINLRKSVEHISEGHFNEKIDIDDNTDEISRLALEFNRMSKRLQKYEKLNLDKIFYEKRKSELTIESMHEPVLMLDEQYNVLLTNKTFNEIFGKEYLSKDNIHKLLEPTLSNHGLGDEETQNVYHDQDIITVQDNNGSKKLFKVIAASLEIPESEMKGTVVVFNDITKYQELDRMKSEFIAKVSHELKTPLTSLGMALGIVEDGVVGELSDKQNELVLSMKEDYDRLNKLVYDILELTKLEASADKIKFEKFPARKLAEYISKKFDILSADNNINLEVVDNSKDIQLYGSYSHIISAVENLVSNSLRFTPNNGRIKYIQESENGYLLVEISDTGIGISPDNLKKIFNKFMQIDDSTPGSLGLGLSIAKEIIEIHHGQIKAFSELGKGSTFQIKLPVA